MKFPVFDLHCDTALALLGDSFRECGSLRKNNLHVDLERAAALPGYAQCFACFTTDATEHIPIAPVELFEREMATVLREIERNSDLIALAYSADEIESNYANGLMSAILTIEGPAGFGYDPELLEDLYKLGFRISTLGWNENNPLTGSHITGGGLTDRGREYVAQAQKHGMIIDVSHISDEGFWDIMNITQAPIIATHSNSRVVCGVSRNITDDMFRAICSVGGVVGLNMYAEFVGKPANMDKVCDHVMHLLELDPDGLHISLGGDLDGCEELPEGFNGIQDYPNLALALQSRGISDQILQNIFWNNAIGVMRRCCI